MSDNGHKVAADIQALVKWYGKIVEGKVFPYPPRATCEEMQGEADKVKAALDTMVDAIPSYIKLEYRRMQERNRAIRRARSKAD